MVTPETLLRQASETADEYLARAIENTEKRMGPGASKKYPEIVAAMIQAASHDFVGAVIASEIGGRLQVGGPLLQLQNPGLADCLCAIANAIRERP